MVITKEQINETIIIDTIVNYIHSHTIKFERILCQKRMLLMAWRC